MGLDSLSFVPSIDSLSFVLSIASLFTTILLGIVAILISVQLHKLTNSQSHTTSKMLGAIEGHVHTLGTQLAGTVANLHALADRLALGGDLPAPARARIHHLSTIAARERAVSKEIWVLAVTIEYDLGTTYCPVIAENIRRGIRYKYFIPKSITEGVDAAVSRFRASLIQQRVEEQQLNDGLKIYAIEQSGLLCNITLFDPNIGEHEGYMLPVYTSRDCAFQVTLDEDLHSRIRAQMERWLRDETSVFPPPSRASKLLKVCASLLSARKVRQAPRENLSRESTPSTRLDAKVVTDSRAASYSF